MHRIQCRREFVGVYLGEKPDPSHVYAQHGSVHGCRDAGTPQKGPVATDGHYQVRVPSLCRLSVGTSTFAFSPDVHGDSRDAVRGCPVSYRLRGFARRWLAVMDD